MTTTEKPEFGDGTAVAYPSLLATGVRDALVDYLSTTFALTDDTARYELQNFLLDRAAGIFRGPYYRVRTPFRSVDPEWINPLDWMPPNFHPYLHQALAFDRLSSRDRAPMPTIVTTGTGSGKTESFLIPLLDHCRRERDRNHNGIKAIILYPMNALVTDQGRRLARMLHDEPALHGVTAGVYIGGQGTHDTADRDHLIDQRDRLREDPPDILLTNYKMLDLLLLRQADQPLWKASRESLQYLVLDEFHTYDGAQGTDVAMLLRRLGAALGLAGPDRPLGRVTPVATSATLGGDEDGGALREFAATVFGCPFDPTAVIGEQRLTPAEVLEERDLDAVVPLVSELLRPPLPDADTPGSWQELAATVFVADPAPPTTQSELTAALARHPLTHVVVTALADGPSTAEAMLARIDLDDQVSLAWQYAARNTPLEAAEALSRFVALLSAARRPDGRPWLTVEVQLWARDVRRLLREVATVPRFGWWSDGPPEEQITQLPAVYCRVCGESGWQALATELGEYLDGTPEKIWRASINDRRRVRTVLLAQPGTVGSRTLSPIGLDLDRDVEGDLHVLISSDAESAFHEICPACGAQDAIRFIGSSVATEASVALTALFGSDTLPSSEKKTLVFTDSVQDAAHRAAFIEGRAFTFNFRSAVLSAVGVGPMNLTKISDNLIQLPDVDLYAITPPDFVRRLALNGAYLSGPRQMIVRNRLAKRLAFQVQLELGLRSRLGRTLELTGAASVDIDIDLPKVSELAAEIHRNLPEPGMVFPEPSAYRVWLLGLLERLRTRGGIDHAWLHKYFADVGRRWHVTGSVAAGMQTFPTGGSAPTAFTTATGTDFDGLTSRGTWLVDWTTRCLGIVGNEANGLLVQVVGMLASGDDPVLLRSAGRGDSLVYVLNPSKVVLRPTTDAQADDGRIRMQCVVCHHVQPIPAVRVVWRGAPCLRMRCTGTLQPAVVAVDNYYRRLYQSNRIRRIVTHEHTGLLPRDQREQVEVAFKEGTDPTAPNVLTCTPTLELGIDIGDMSAVALASLPRSTASYLQRVGRAGRSTGNALVLATVPSGPRDLYFFSEPLHLIAGRVTPPSTYLRATELLQRQYLAFCFDEVARGNLAISAAMPPRIDVLFGLNLKPGSWLRDFSDLVTSQWEQLSSRFLALYSGSLDIETSTRLQDFARTGANVTIGAKVADWHEQRTEIGQRLADLGAAQSALKNQGHLDDHQTLELRALTGEWRVLKELREKLGNADTFSGLVQWSLLPNYNLHDDATTLEVSLWWTTDDGGGSANVEREEYHVDRGSRQALSEFAPGNTFYAFGQQIAIDAVDPGPAGKPAWTQRRLCPACGWSGNSEPVSECPRCGSHAAADTGAIHKVLPLTKVSAHHHRDDTVIDDDADDRKQRPFQIVTSVDIEPEHINGAWRLADRVFGAEYAHQATVRALNVGPMGLGGSDISLAGEHCTATLFRTCSGCGLVHTPGTFEDRLRHRGWCPTRKGHAVVWQDLMLSHELVTQAVRILLPISDFHVAPRMVAFAGALLLGLRRDFGGDPQHLAIVQAVMPDHEGRPRRFLVLHDVVPGGTGYLDRFGDPDRLHRILTFAHEQLKECPCRDEGREACHRCLLSVVPSRDIPLTDRSLAVELLDDLLSDWRTEVLQSLSSVDISEVQLNELEQQFSENVKQWVAGQPDGMVTEQSGTNGLELSFSYRTASGGVRTWLMKALHGVTAVGVRTEPDFQFIRQDSVSSRIAVYLDGKEFHASKQHNRTADDARKRTALRDNDYRVISLTFADVQDWAVHLSGARGDADNLVDAATAAVILGLESDPLVSKLWAPAVDLLTALLDDPDAKAWGRGAGQLVGKVATDRVEEQLEADGSLKQIVATWGEHGQISASPETGLVVFQSTLRPGLPLLLLLETTNLSSIAMGAVVVLDDSPASVGSESHDKNWRAWLRWSNVLQFLGTGTVGWSEIWSRQSIESLFQRHLSFDIPTPDADVMWPAEWGVVLEFTDRKVEDLVKLLASEKTAIPEPGAEVGEGYQVWQVELAWPDRKIAVVIDDDTERDSWLMANGWSLVHHGDHISSFEQLTELWAGE